MAFINHNYFMTSYIQKYTQYNYHEYRSILLALISFKLCLSVYTCVLNKAHVQFNQNLHKTVKIKPR